MRANETRRLKNTKYLILRRLSPSKRSAGLSNLSVFQYDLIYSAKGGTMLLGQILVREGLCTRTDIRIAHGRQMIGDDKMLGEILLDLGIISAEDLSKALIKQRKAMIGATRLLMANRLRQTKYA